MFFRRFTQLQAGLIFYGASLALMVRANLGLNPWSVFHLGLSEATGLSLGLTVNLVGALVLIVWWPLGQKPGVGTVCNVLVIGTTTDFFLRLMPPIEGWFLRGFLLISGVVLNSVAAGAYIGAGLGPGPRDGLTMGAIRLTGWKVRWVRTGIEATVLALGWVLGGTVGLGTVLYAVVNGPLLQRFLPMFMIPDTKPVRSS